MAQATAEKAKVTKPAPKPAASVKSAKKAVIATGGHQHLVSEGQTLEVELLDPKLSQKNTVFEALMVIDGENITVGTPTVSGVNVTADIVEQSVKGDKVVAIRYKAKKRVRKVRGHRQRHTLVRITKIG
jgi:large subunit ribosomal protein L21